MYALPCNFTEHCSTVYTLVYKMCTYVIVNSGVRWLCGIVCMFAIIILNLCMTITLSGVKVLISIILINYCAKLCSYI